MWRHARAASTVARAQFVAHIPEVDCEESNHMVVANTEPAAVACEALPVLHRQPRRGERLDALVEPRRQVPVLFGDERKGDGHLREGCLHLGLQPRVEVAIVQQQDIVAVALKVHAHQRVQRVAQHTERVER